MILGVRMKAYIQQYIRKGKGIRYMAILIRECVANFGIFGEIQYICI